MTQTTNPTNPAPCPTCGTPVPEGHLCPRCLLGAGLGEGGPGDAAAPPSPEEIGKDFPAFEILEVLGQGGMGIVYKARQKSLDRIVALKVLPPDVAREPGFADRFTREARTLARLHHEHIVGVYEFGETNGLFYLVMEFVDGPNLRQVIREGKLEAAQALAIVPQICEALQYAHDQGVVHRDIKPENVLLDRAGRVKIADFGLAKLAQRAPLDLTLTRAGQVMGTLQYMAPEQYREPDSVDHRADIFSLGVVFYEMLTGELPVGTFPPPSTHKGVDARLDGVVLRALERERDRRWQKASDMGTRIDTIASGVDVVPAAAAAPSSPRVTKPGPSSLPSSVPVSTLAIAGVLGMPAASVVGLLASPLPWPISPIAVVIILIIGWITSIVAWERVRGSRGRLRGLPAAILGALLPPLLVLGVLAARLPLLHSSAGTAIVPDRGALNDPLEVAASAARVVGGPPGMTDEAKARLVLEMNTMWPRLMRLSLSEPNPAVKRLVFSKADRKRLDAMSPAERAAAEHLERLGMPFYDLRQIEQPDELRLAWVALDGGGAGARVVFRGAVHVLAFGVMSEDGVWYPALGPVEVENRGLEDEDRTGWIGRRWFGPGMDPAQRVTGGPASLSDADRHKIAKDLADAYDHQFPQNPQLRLYHAVLDSTGLKGLMVSSNGRATFIHPVERAGLEDATWDFREKVEERWGAPDPRDQDGHLHR